MNFLSGAVQLMPITLCQELAPLILQFAQGIEDPTVKVRAYLTIEVLFASRRFENIGLAASLLSSMLTNCETALTGTNEGETENVSSKDQMRVVAYI